MAHDEDARSSSRRGFLRLSGLRAGKLVAGAAGVPLPAKAPPPPAPGVGEAAPATATCGVDELVVQAGAAGLGARLEAVRALARTSVRATRARDGAEPGAWAGSGRVDDAGRTLVLHVALTHPAVAGLAGHLPGGRHLRIWTATGGGEGARPVRVEIVAAAAPRGTALELTEELVLPRAWSDAVQALDLDDDEHDAWIALRRTLAARQGTEPDDAGVAWHRIGGYPDERTGLLPVLCERAATGVPEGAPDPPELAARATRWQLLAQLSADPGLGLDWGPGVARLSVWVDGAALRAGDLSGAVALAR